jgi:hypothetical protein
MNIDTDTKIQNEIQNALNSKLGFEPDPKDPLASYKDLVSDKIRLYFAKARDGHGPVVGYWIKDEINDTLRKNLTVELNNVVPCKYCNNPQENEEAGGWWIWCYITALNESVVDWIVIAMEEVERRALFMINK